MMGGANKASAAMTAAPLSGTRRIGAGTIGEAAAIARRAAMGEERGPVADTTTDPFPESADGKRRAAPLPNSTESLSKTIEPSEVAPEPGLVRHSKAGAGQLKGDTQDGSFERTGGLPNPRGQGLCLRPAHRYQGKGLKNWRFAGHRVVVTGH